MLPSNAQAIVIAPCRHSKEQPTRFTAQGSSGRIHSHRVTGGQPRADSLEASNKSFWHGDGSVLDNARVLSFLGGVRLKPVLLRSQLVKDEHDCDDFDDVLFGLVRRHLLEFLRPGFGVSKYEAHLFMFRRPNIVNKSVQICCVRTLSLLVLTRD